SPSRNEPYATRSRGLRLVGDGGDTVPLPDVSARVSNEGVKYEEVAACCCSCSGIAGVFRLRVRRPCRRGRTAGGKWRWQLVQRDPGQAFLPLVHEGSGRAGQGRSQVQP